MYFIIYLCIEYYFVTNNNIIKLYYCAFVRYNNCEIIQLKQYNNYYIGSNGYSKVYNIY